MRLIFLPLIFLPSIIYGQGFIALDTLDSYPEPLTELFKGEISSICKVDFTGDNQDDYLVLMTSEDKNQYVQNEYWVTSEFLLFKKIKRYNEGIRYFHFVNLDDDPELEFYLAYGYEDGIDYGFFDLNMKTGEDKLLFYFNPIILEDGVEYWGYPWDISNIMSRYHVDRIQLFSSTNHDIRRDGMITIPEDQQILPAIYFEGHSTQPSIHVGKIRRPDWYTVEKLIKLCTTAP